MRQLNDSLVFILQAWGSHECRTIGLESPPITPIGKLLCSPGRSTRAGMGPRYEPDPIAQRVNEAIVLIDAVNRLLIECKYRDGMSDRIVGLICGISEGKARWLVEKAHRDIAGKLKLPVYR